MANPTEPNSRTTPTNQDIKQAEDPNTPTPHGTKEDTFDDVFALDTDPPSEVASTEDSVEQNETALPFDVPDDVTFEPETVSAFKDYDERETTPQAAEFYRFPHGDHFDRNGRF